MKIFKKWNKKIGWGLLIIPLTWLISFLLLAIFIEAITNGKTNFIKTLIKNINWKILLTTLIISLIAYGGYIYLIIFKKKNKKNQPNIKETIAPEVINAIQQIGNIVMQIESMLAELLEKTELNAIEKMKKAKIERSLNELLSSLKDS